MSANSGSDAAEVFEIYRTVFQIIAPYIDGLVHEFYQITGYVRSEMQTVKFEDLFMYGQANAINALNRYIEKRLSIPAKNVNPMQKLCRSDRGQSSDMSEDLSFSQALGLAMREVT